MLLLLIAGFYHMALGLQVVIEDYVRHRMGEARALVLNRFAAFALAVAGDLRGAAHRAGRLTAMAAELSDHRPRL